MARRQFGLMAVLIAITGLSAIFAFIRAWPALGLALTIVGAWLAALAYVGGDNDQA